MDEQRAGKWLYQCCACYKHFMLFEEEITGVACPYKECMSFNVRLFTGRRRDDHLKCERAKQKP